MVGTWRPMGLSLHRSEQSRTYYGLLKRSGKQINETLMAADP